MDRFPLSKTEYGIYIEQMTARSTAYNNPFAIPLPDTVDQDRFRNAVCAFVAAHPYLNTGFGTDETGEVYKFLRDREPEIELPPGLDATVSG